MDIPQTSFQGWAAVELFGHRVLFGYFSEVTVCGETFARIDIPSEPPTWGLKNGKALYGIKPTTEAAVRNYHKRLSMPALASAAEADLVDHDDDDDDDDDDDLDAADSDAPLPPRAPAMDPINPELGMGDSPADGSQVDDQDVEF